MSGNHRTRRIFSEMRAETLDEELVTKMKGIGSQELLKEIADGKIPYYDGFGNDFLSYLVQAKRVDLAMVVQEKYYLSNPRGGFIPHDPIRTALLENNPKFFHGKTFDPTQKMEISFFHDSLIESIALKTNNKINGQEWFGVFKQLIAGRAAEESFSDSLKLLPEPFRQEIESNFKEHHRSDSPSLMIGGGAAAHQLSRDLSVAPRGERK